jgi:hypothetical protein
MPKPREDVTIPLSQGEADALADWLKCLIPGEPVSRKFRLAVTAEMYVAANDAGCRAPVRRVAALQSLSFEGAWNKIAEVTPEMASTPFPALAGEGGG